MRACARAREREFTNSTPRCLAGKVNTAEKMTESTRCLRNGARHGHRHTCNENTGTHEKETRHKKDKHLRVQNK